LKFYFISFGSLRECQSILSLAKNLPVELSEAADHLGACLYKLTRS
jgi:hypothetical protein